ncbi:MAG: hypothetical protein WCT49_02760 [Candidatus Paceibacterota bacterium]|jgi:regulator of protease activity HflC (stomatin/prohibitin superfamily)|nr:hypothetical protein [Candidatus Paceibacterota bacterium]
MLLNILWWLLLFISISGPLIIPWWWSLYVGWCLFTTLNNATGAMAAIRVQNGKEVETSYTDKKGVAKIGHITSGGTYDGVILPRGYRLKDCDEPELAGKKEIEKFDETVDWLSYASILRSYGIYWIGPPPARRASYRFVWTEFAKNTGGEGNVIRREEPTDFFYVARVEYAITTENVEIGGNAFVDLTFSVFIRIVVPEIAFCGNVDVIAQLGTTLKTEADTFFRSIQYEDLKKKENEKSFSDVIKSGPTKTTLGIIVDEVRLSNVGGKLSDTIRDAFQAALVATKTGEATIISATKTGEAKVITAKANATAKNLDTDAEKRRIDETYAAKAKHPDMARYEAIEKAGDKGSAIVFEGPRAMTDDAKSMLVAMKSTSNNDAVKKPEDEMTDLKESKQEETKPEDTSKDPKGRAKKRGGKNDSAQ